jgi:hypothetical protein
MYKVAMTGARLIGPQMDDYYVYEHWRTDTNTCFYVGKGRAKRAYDMKNRSFFHRMVQVRSSMTVKVKFVAQGLSEIESSKIESKRVGFWRKQRVKLVNIAENAVENNTYESYLDEMLDENERKLDGAHRTSRTKPKTR